MKRVILLSIAVALAAFALWIGLKRLDPFAKQPFDRHKWLTAANAGLGIELRGPMVRDLVARHLSPGTSKTKVVWLLGAPDEQLPAEGNLELNTGPDPNTKYILRYGVGSWSGLRIDSDHLYVGFDSRNRVSGAWIVQH